MITVNLTKKANTLFELDILKNNVTYFYCLLEFWDEEDLLFSEENLTLFKEYLTADLMYCRFTYENISKIVYNNMSETPFSKASYEEYKYGNLHNLITEKDKEELINRAMQNDE